MKRKSLKLLFAILIYMVSVKAFAHDVAVENDDGVTIYYNYINNGTELAVTYRGSSYSSYSKEYTGNVVIPESVTILNNTRKVTCIGSEAFRDCSSLASITIPSNVMSINRRAFSGCSGLTSITIPSNVTSIDSEAFYQCSGLTKVIVKDIVAWCRISFSDANSNPLYYAKHFYSDEDTEIINLVIPDGVTSIGDHAFCCFSNLTSITIPSSLISIGCEAFEWCNGLTKVIVKDIVAWCDISFCDILSNPLNFAEHLYSDEDTEITNLVIPDGATSIGKYAFMACSSLTSITIPSSLTSIGDGAFGWCSGLTKVIVKDLAAWCGISFSDSSSNPLYYAHHLYSDDDTEITNLVIPDGVTSIGNYAFEDCSGLISVTIPASVTSIGKYAFGYNNNLAEIVSLIQEPFKVSNIVSDFIYNNGTLYVPYGTMEKYKATDGWKQFVWMKENAPTGIQSPKDSSNVTETQRYTIGGQSINNPQRGLNIIKMSDGKTKKVMVK